jgi:hypothetical protein
MSKTSTIFSSSGSYLHILRAPKNSGRSNGMDVVEAISDAISGAFGMMAAERESLSECNA